MGRFSAGKCPKKKSWKSLMWEPARVFPVLLGEKGHHVTGIDITENMIRRAAENISAAGVKGGFSCYGLPEYTIS